MGLYEGAVEEAARRVAEAVKGGELRGRVLIFLPPGNSRTAVADALCDMLKGASRKCAVYTYKRGGMDIETIMRPAAEGVAVVVPRDFLEAVELGRGLKGLEAEYVFLPALYEEALKGRGVKVEGWQRADYSFAESLYGVKLWPKARGVHLSLLREGVRAEVAEGLRALWRAPEGLLGRLKGLGRAALEEAYREALGVLVGMAFAALFGPVGGVAQLLVSTAKRLVYRGGEEVLKYLEREDDPAARIARWLLAVREAGEEYEALLCEDAARIGAKCDDAKKATATAPGIEEVRRAVEEGLRRLEIEVAGVKLRLEAVEKVQQPVYRGSIPDIAVEGDVYRLADGARVVLEGGFGELAERVLEELRTGRLVVLRGPRGAGKTTLALLAAQRWIEEGRPVLKLVNFDDKILSETYKSLDGKFLVLADPSPLEVYSKAAGAEGLPVLKVEPKRLSAEAVARLLRNAVDAKVPTLVVLTDEEYEEFAKLSEKPDHVVIDVGQFREEFYRRLIEEYGGGKALPRGELDELVRQVMQYRGATALVAKYIGRALTEGFDPRKALEEGKGDAKAFLKAILRQFLQLKSDDKRKRAALGSIYYAKLKAVEEVLGRASPSEAGALGGAFRWRYVFTPDLVKEITRWNDESLEEAGASVLARINEDLVEEALAELLGFEIREGKIVAPQERRDLFEEQLEDIVKNFAEGICKHPDKETIQLIGMALLGHYEAPEGVSDNWITFGNTITPGAIWLIHLAVRRGVPLAGLEEACSELKKEIGENTLWDAAVRAAYAYAALTRGRDGGCVEKALYALNWSIPHVGPLAEAAIYTAFATLGRVGAVDGAPQMLLTILDRHGYRLGVCEGAKSLLGELYRGAEGKSWTYRAYLAEALAEAASKCGLEEAARVAEGLLGELGEEERLLASGAYYSLAQWLRARGELDEAERYAELLGEVADRLAGAARGEADQHFKERAAQYLKWRSLKRPEEALVEFAESLRVLAAGLRGDISLDRYVRGLEERPDAEAFAEVADMSKRRYDAYKSPDAFVNYLIACGLYGRALFLSGEYGKALQVLEETWKEPWPDAPYLEVAADALVHYAVALIHGGRVGEAEELLREYGFLLRHFPRGWPAFYLYARALGVEAEKPPNLENAILGEVDDAFKPAMRLALTGQMPERGCAELCMEAAVCLTLCVMAPGEGARGEETAGELNVKKMLENLSRECVEKCGKRVFVCNLCEGALAAACGNVHAAEKIRTAVTSAIVERYEEDVLRVGSSRVSLREVLNRFGVAEGDYGIFKELGGRELVEMVAPKGTFGQMLLLFKAASEGNLRLAKAHALMGALEMPRLFAEVYNALKDISTIEEARRRPEYKTALTKLLLHHV